jgi:DNA primase
MQATAERYHAGLTKEAIQYLAGRGIPRKVVDQYLLGICDDIHGGWLSIPYLRPSGVAHFNYRRLDDGKPKYIGAGKKHLFNTAAFDAADQTGEIAVCEGELDTIVATALCGVPAVGIPGATQWTGNRHWHELFVGYQRIWVLADPDDAGESLASQILDRFASARLVKLPGDVNQTYLQHGGIKEFIRG